MKIRRYFGRDAREAMRLLREDLGPDALILANRNTNGGVEIIAAEDYDERDIAECSAIPDPAVARPGAGEPEPLGSHAVADRNRPTGGNILGEMQREIRSLRGLLEQQMSQFALANTMSSSSMQVILLGRLRAIGLGLPLAQAIACRCAEAEDLDSAWRSALTALVQLVRTEGDDILDSGGVVSLLGPTGVGKTTTVAKLAARYAARHGKRHVALVSTDGVRVGACEQLQLYGRLLGIPVYWAQEATELKTILADLSEKHLVLIDTAGVSQRDIALIEKLAPLVAAHKDIRHYLVLAANVQLANLHEVIRNFRNIPLAGCLITKLDEAASLGEMLSAAIQHDLAIGYLSDGQRVPEDLQPARPHNLVARAVALMKSSAQRTQPPSDDEQKGNLARAG